MGLVEALELLEWEIADDIAVKNKEGRVVLAKNIACKGQRAG